jgi:hypothetical protein
MGEAQPATHAARSVKDRLGAVASLRVPRANFHLQSQNHNEFCIV